jgi:hypothetical protein
MSASNAGCGTRRQSCCRNYVNAPGNGRKHAGDAVCEGLRGAVPTSGPRAFVLSGHSTRNVGRKKLSRKLSRLVEPLVSLNNDDGQVAEPGMCLIGTPHFIGVVSTSAKSSSRGKNMSMAATSCRRAVSVSFGIGLLATGCTEVFKNGGPPSVIYNTPFGSTPISPGNQPWPAQDLQAPATSINRDGVYSGIAVPLDTGGGICIKIQPVSDFRVRGNSVQWGKFQGRIENNGLQMVFGNTWVYGQVVGDRFDGQITTSGRFGAPGCSYMMT